MFKLAINGGEPIRKKLFPKQDNFDSREKAAALRVLNNGRLSGYRGNWCPEFFGGEEVKSLEKEFASKFKAKYAIACNSATSGLQIACGAVGLAPGDEVVVTPWSMSCSATAPLLYNAIPVFADIEEDYYCLDYNSIKERITSKTKAIIIVDLFGQPYDVGMINQLAKENNLMVIEDAAQAIGSKIKQNEDSPPFYNTKYAGTFGDIGVFSFNYGKHITCGEGGMIVTDNESLAMRCRLIMNHAEAVINGMHTCYQPSNIKDFNIDNNMLGFNMRMTEIQAAITRVQLEKFNSLLLERLRNIVYLKTYLENIPAITPPEIREDYTHTFYVQAFKWDKDKAGGLHRDKFIEAVKAELTPIEGREQEGVPLNCGYIKPLYLFPLFQNKKLYGGSKYPFYDYTDELMVYFINAENQTFYCRSEHNYNKGICPTAERLQEEELFLHRFFAPPTTFDDLKDVSNAFYKVWENRRELK
jgi:dTDP-4-amino-4,6-dideoxygalactose transaminase